MDALQNETDNKHQVYCTKNNYPSKVLSLSSIYAFISMGSRTRKCEKERERGGEIYREREREKERERESEREKERLKIQTSVS